MTKKEKELKKKNKTLKKMLQLREEQIEVLREIGFCYRDSMERYVEKNIRSRQ